MGRIELPRSVALSRTARASSLAVLLRPWLVALVVAALTHLLVPGAWYVAAGALSGLAAAWLLAGDA